MCGLYLFKYRILNISVHDLALYVEYSIVDSQEKHIFLDVIVKEGTAFQHFYNVIWRKNDCNARKTEFKKCEIEFTKISMFVQNY